MKLPLLSVTIRRDPFTTTTTTAPAHELAMMRTIFGRENVKADRKAVGEREFDVDAEYERLARKYGVERVVAVYGEEENSRLSEMMKPSSAKKED